MSIAPLFLHERYPDTDGLPMAETDTHRRWMFIVIGRLQRWYAAKRIYVSGNLLIYYLKGKPEKCFAPDVFVVKNCEQKERRIFKTWLEGRLPSWVLELTSESTRTEDIQVKLYRYASLGIREYFLYDPLGEWLEPRLIGYRLSRGEYVKIEPGTDDTILSRELGILFTLDGSELVMRSAATGELVLSNEEITQIAEQRAEEERLRAEEERLHAEEERLRAEAAEGRLARMTAEMDRLRQELGRKPNGKAKP